MKNSILSILVLVLGLFLAGCQSLGAVIPDQPPVVLTIEQVKPDSNPGQYVLYGQTSLPDGTELTVSATRPLTSSAPEVSLSEPVVHSTLARSSATTENGRWQTQLQLWQASPEGLYQEIWQMQEPLASLPLSPQQEVLFAVTLSPNALAQSEQKPLKDLKRLGKSPAFNVTPAGEPYLESRQALAVSLPSPNRTATVPTQNSKPSLWAGRTAQSQMDSSFTSDQGLPFAENNNLPITASNVLQ